MPSFLSLPNELILQITDNLQLHDINALLQTNRRLSDLKSTLLTELIRSRSLTHGRRLLYQLSAQRDLESVAYLIERGILDFTDRETLLHEAVIFHSVHVLETLLRSGLGPNTRDAKGRTPLNVAVREGRVDVVRVMVARGDVDVDSQDDDFMTPLLIAVQYGEEEVAQILVQSGNADLQNISDDDGRNCLHHAVLGECVSIVRFLLGFMDPNGKDHKGWTALHSAVDMGYCRVMESLLEDERMDANAQDNEGRTAFYVAVEKGQLNIVEILFSDSRVKTDKADFKGKTPSNVAAGGSNVGIIYLLSLAGGEREPLRQVTDNRQNLL